MNFRIIRPVTEPSKEVGQTVAWTFDCGRIESEKYGNGYIYGHIPSLLPYIDIETMLDTTESKDLDETRQYLADVFFSFGINEEMLQESSHETNVIFTEELLDIFSAIYPEHSLRESVLVLGMFAFAYLAETMIEKGRDNMEDVSVIVLDLTDLIKGTSDKAIPNSGIKMSLNMTIVAALCHITRTEAKKIDSSAWVYLEQDMIAFIGAMELEGQTKSITEENYRIIREFTACGKAFLESAFIVYGTKIPDVIRTHTLYVQLMNLVSLFSALINDLIGLRKEIEVNDEWNLVLLRTKKHGFQAALESTVDEASNVRHKIIQIEKELINTFPNEKCLPFVFAHIANFEFISTNFYTMDLGMTRYGDKIKVTQTVIEYVEETKNASTAITLPEQTIGVQTYQNQVNDNTSLFKQLKFDDKKEKYVKMEQISENIVKIEPIFKQYNLHKFEADPTVKNELNINHLAIIPDGNRRWAKSKGFQGHMGHEHGIQSMISLMKKFFELNIHTATAWGMSTENFSRPHHEKQALFSYMCQFFETFLNVAHAHETRIHHIGSIKRLPAKLKRRIAKAMRETAHYTKHIFNIAIDYGGIQEIVDAVNQIEKLPITKEELSKLMYTGNQPYPEPDVIIRTGSIDSKTVRTSGFMPWQSTYSEFVFLDKYMPDMTPEDIDEIMEYFKKANRRFGT